MKHITLALALSLLPAVALAAEQSPPEPSQLALGQMVGECQNREAQALIQLYTLRAQLAAERKKSEPENKTGPAN